MVSFELLTKGNTDFINITKQVEEAAAQLSTQSGVVTLFLPSTTAALVIMEDEDGAKADLKATLEKLVPQNGEYKHNAKWGDTNGFAQVRSSLMNVTLSIPIDNGKLVLGKWQSVLLVDFDTQERSRTVHVTM